MERGIELEDYTLPNGTHIKHQILYHDVDNPASLDEIKTFNPQLILEREFNTGKHIYSDLLTQFPDIPKAAWLIDTHVSWERHKEYAKLFDYVFLAISKFVEPMKKEVGHGRVYWLPLSWPYRSDTIQPNRGPIKFPISFVGRFSPQTHPDRALYVGALAERYQSSFVATTDYNNMLSIVKRSKISFNKSLDDDLNFRVWEVMGAGTELVTDDVTDIHKIKGLEWRIHVYQDFPQCTDKISRILADDPNTTKNVLDNQQWVKTRHCLIHRHLALLDMVRHGVQHEF